MQLAEKWRPKTWDDLVGHDKLKATIARYRQRGCIGGRSFFIRGPSGCGKSTAGWLICAETADPFNIEEIDARRLTPAGVEQIRHDMHYRALGGKPGKGWIISEAQGLNKATLQSLLVLIDSPTEPMPDWAVVVFCTTIEGQLTLEGMDDSGPLLSRCTELQLDRRGWVTAGKGAPGPAALRLYQIAEAEGLNGKPIAAYVKLLQSLNGNLRRAIQAVDSGAMLD